MGIHNFWITFIFTAFCCQFRVSNSQLNSCDSKDLNALISFLSKHNPESIGWGNNSTCCYWSGVKCENSRVTYLHLVERKLNDVDIKFLSNLDQLEYLNLSSNSIRGNLPPDFFDLKHLECLDLSNNKFSGQIPRVSHLSSLRVFNISNNFFGGNQPIFNESNELVEFDISFNNFTGFIRTDFCRHWRKIQLFRASVNYFNGNFPTGFGNCSSLHKLYLDTNLLTGSLPDDLFSLSSLNILCLQENSLSGVLSDKVSNLSNLVRLDVSLNEFNGALPDIFDYLKKIQQFSAQSNHFSGAIPSSLSNSSSLILLNLRNNSLTGGITINCISMIRLGSLDLGSNQFEGNIPNSLSGCKELKTINLARNRLVGQIPENFKDFSSLTSLSLSNNSFHNIYEALNVLQNCKNLSTLVLTMNFRGEEMPSDGIKGFETLKALIIPNCRLVGSIPMWLSSSSKIQLIDLSWNHLSGTIPPWFGNLDSLFYLDLSNNSLTGKVPKSLTQLKSLTSDMISQEEYFSTYFPLFRRVNRSSRVLQYNQISSFRPSIILSYNEFSGPLWPEFGNLKNIHVLDLSHNNFSGIIPSELSYMTNLEILDLSYNDLSGNIPYSLTKLTLLSFFSVAHNRLYGRIPYSVQFTTFPNSSFEGNPGLCGEPWIPCSQQGESIKTQRRNKRTAIGIALGIALGTAFFLMLTLFLCSRNQIMRLGDEKKVNVEGEKLEQASSKLVTLFQSKDIIEITIDDVINSTNNFDQANIIGCGGFGLVYKATLPDGKMVAIKRLSGDYGQTEKEFQAEVETLSRAQHKNLVLLQGYCTYGKDKLLIYSYLENGSLDYWLHEKSTEGISLEWETRLRISQGVARGLAYLHLSCQPHILHRDIKSSNILLDENFESHLADFGLARLIFPYETHVTTDLIGTLGYIPPEYGQASIATFKGDIYSFGVVLLELLTGKRPMDATRPKWCRDLISWALEMKEESKEHVIFDPLIYDKQYDKEMMEVLEIACLCLNKNPKERPCIQQIVQWLDKIGFIE